MPGSQIPRSESLTGKVPLIRAAAQLKAAVLPRWSGAAAAAGGSCIWTKEEGKNLDWPCSISMTYRPDQSIYEMKVGGLKSTIKLIFFILNSFLLMTSGSIFELSYLLRILF